MLQLRKIKKVFTNFPRGFCRFPTKFQRFKNSTVLEPRTGQFLRTKGFEAKAKDLTFEAKDFKMCPRGQGRPRGLHLWTALIFEQLKFRWKTPETSRKICEHLFCFPRLEHRRSRRGRKGPGSPSIESSPMTKM